LLLLLLLLLLKTVFKFEGLHQLQEIQIEFLVGSLCQGIDRIGPHQVGLIGHLLAEQFQCIRDLDGASFSPLLQQFRRLYDLRFDGPIDGQQELGECLAVVDQTEAKAPQQVFFFPGRMVGGRGNDGREFVPLGPIRLEGRIDQSAQEIVCQGPVLVVDGAVVFVFVVQKRNGRERSKRWRFDRRRRRRRCLLLLLLLLLLL